MLTGNKDEDLKLLTNLYNQYGKNVLTSNYDVNYEILKKLDIKSLNRFCIINKNAKEICNNKEFWLDKFRNDDLPIMDAPTTIEQWIKMYNVASDAKTDIRRLMIINEMQNNNVIIVSGSEMWLYVFLGIRILGIRSSNKRIITLNFIKKNNRYEYIINDETRKMNKDDFIAFLIRAQYFILNEEYGIEIVDDNNIPFIFNQNTINWYIKDNYDEAYSRYNILNTIVFLEKHTEMLHNEWLGKKIFYN